MASSDHRILGAVLDALVEIEGVVDPELTQSRWAPFEVLDLPLLWHNLGDESAGVEELSTSSDGLSIPLVTTIAFEPSWPVERHDRIEQMFDVYLAHVIPGLRDFEDHVPFGVRRAQLVGFDSGFVDLRAAGGEVSLPSLTFSLLFDLDLRF